MNDKKQETIIRIGGVALIIIGSLDIAAGVVYGPLLLILPGVLFWVIGVLALATGNM